MNSFALFKCSAWIPSRVTISALQTYGLIDCALCGCGHQCITQSLILVKWMCIFAGNNSGRRWERPLLVRSSPSITWALAVYDPFEGWPRLISLAGRIPQPGRVKCRAGETLTLYLPPREAETGVTSLALTQCDKHLVIWLRSWRQCYGGLKWCNRVLHNTRHECIFRTGRSVWISFSYSLAATNVCAQLPSTGTIYQIWPLLSILWRTSKFHLCNMSYKVFR